MLRRRLKYTGIALVSAVLLGAIFLGVQLYFGNFHETIEGELYRSAQLEEGDLTRYVEKYKIASVINLRGENIGSPWYDDEVREAKSLGITHIDFRMKRSRELTDGQAFALIEAMRTAPKPLLIHCYSGADRTGLAAALYLAAIAKRSEWSSERQLWLNYGHMPFGMGESVAMNRTFERLESYLGFGDS
ncbi:MAG: tyrosine-protein phosphatase [Pseudomonadota bacterium]